MASRNECEQRSWLESIEDHVPPKTSQIASEVFRIRNYIRKQEEWGRILDEREDDLISK